MIRRRDAAYCNLKLLLIFLVVYGHLIESKIGQSSVFALQYKIIYLFHMPLFVFLSGLFLTTSKQCLAQGRRMLGWYLGIQGTLSLLWPEQYTLSLPYWHLWYLLSFACWCALGWLLCLRPQGRISKGLLLALSVGIACWAGTVPKIGRPFSLSRTLVFLPFFLAGLFCPREVPWRRLRLLGLGGLTLGIAAYRKLKPVSVYFLYHAAPYTGSAGWTARLWALAAGLGLGLFLLTWTPELRLPCSKIGNDTFWIFLLHAPLVRELRKLPLEWWSAPLLAAGVVWLLFKLFQWWGPMCAIGNFQRKEEPFCQPFNKSMKNTAGRSTGSSWP